MSTPPQDEGLTDLSVYLVTDSAQAAGRGRSLAETVREAVAGGVTAVQVREKDADTTRMLAVVREVAAVLPEGVMLLVNDDVDAYLAARAEGVAVHGVHVGQSDEAVVAVRERIGPEAVLGLSASTPDQLAAAAESPARVDYVGIGAVHDTSSKADAPASLGLDRAGELAAVSALPAVAIGGLTPSDLPTLRRAGFVGAAVVSWLCGADDPRSAAADLAIAWGAGA